MIEGTLSVVNCQGRIGSAATALPGTTVPPNWIGNMTNNAEVWLCLSGGNALGAYHAGAYETLHQAGVRPTKIAGASVGAIVGALIAGNRPEDRIDRISAFWRIASDKFSLANAAPHWNTTKMASALGTLVHGRPGLFWPSMTQWWRRLAGLPSPSLFDRTELRSNLEKLIDFGRLNRGEIHLLISRRRSTECSRTRRGVR